MLNVSLMKKKLLIIIVLLGLVLVGNWVYGNVLAHKIEDRLLHLAKSMDDELLIEFDEVHVNPLLSKLQLRGLTISKMDGRKLATGQTVILDMPYREAIRLVNRKHIDELNSLKLKVEQLQVYVLGEDKLVVDNLQITFSGQLSKEDIHSIQTAFPDEKQRLRIQAKGVEFSQTPWMDALGFTKEQIANINHFDQLLVDCQLLPQQSQLELMKFQLNSDFIDCQSNGVLNYRGEGLKNTKVEKSESSFKLYLKEKGLTWGDAETTGRFSLDKLDIESDAVVVYHDSVPSVESQKSHILLENLTLEYAGKKQAQLEAQTALLGLKMDKITVSRLAINSNLVDNRLTITDSELQSSVMNIDLNAKVNISPDAPSASQIEAATLILSNLAPGIQNGLATFELMTMQSLPRKGNDIVLEMSGALARPDIKGLRY